MSDKPIKVHGILIEKRPLDSDDYRCHMPPVEISEYFNRYDHAETFRNDFRSQVKSSDRFDIIALTISNRN